MSFLTTLCDSAENKLVRTLGGYRKAAQIHSNIALLHDMQASNVHFDDFIEEEEYSNGTISLEKLLKPKKESIEIDMSGTTPP